MPCCRHVCDSPRWRSWRDSREPRQWWQCSRCSARRKEPQLPAPLLRMKAESSINPGLQWPAALMGITTSFVAEPEKANQLISTAPDTATLNWSAREAYSLTSLSHPFPLGEQCYLSACYRYFRDRAPWNQDLITSPAELLFSTSKAFLNHHWFPEWSYCRHINMFTCSVYSFPIQLNKPT